MPDGKEEFISIVVLTATLLQEEGVKTMVVIGLARSNHTLAFVTGPLASRRGG